MATINISQKKNWKKYFCKKRIYSNYVIYKNILKLFFLTNFQYLGQKGLIISYFINSIFKRKIV